MKFAVTVISPPGYTHSAAFQEVAESVHHALLTLGHDSIITQRTDYPGRQHIVLGSCTLPRYPQELASGSILYNLEQISPDSPWLTPDLMALFRRYPLWDYNRRNIEQFRQMGIDGVVHVPLGYVPELTRIDPVDEDIDVLFIGSMNERRLAIIEALRERGVRAEWRFGLYGAERDRLIARARIILNVHYYDAKIFEAVRVSYLLTNKRFVISERGSSPEDDEEYVAGVVFAAYDELADTCVDYLARPERRAEIAAAGFELMRGRPQAALLEPALRALAEPHPEEASVVGHGLHNGVVAHWDRRLPAGPGPALPDLSPVRQEPLTEAQHGDAALTVTGQQSGHDMAMIEEPAQPRVSVVMPVFNHADLTASCLTSLVETTDECGITLELVVVDNASTDETPRLLATLVEGDVTVLRNEVNRGFGEACNQGAAIARGEFILFLNNDTVLLPGWLPPLVAALDEDPSRAAVQPRLIYPDGRLNDAGGLVFRNGDAWVYGKGARILDAPQYATRRAPDYVTGACMLIRRSAFEEVGGFDPRYAPAYYEDTDLSFALRSAGWALLYEPASTIVHLEGGTAGTDVSTGLKQYQVRNKGVFARKWEDDLSRRPDLDPSIVDAWAHRGQGGWGPGEDAALRDAATQARTILSIDPFPPLWDRAGGGLRTMQLLQSLREEGHVVIHVAAANAPERARYAAALSRIGVPLYGVDPADTPDDPVERVLLKSAYLPDLTTLVQRHRPDVVLVSPWGTAEYLIDPLRTLLPDAMIAVDTCDVHFVRERREAELAGDAALARQAEANRDRELAVYAKADRIVCASAEDAAAVREAIPGCDVVVAGLAHDEVDPGPGFSERGGLLFIGNANHPPNLDAVKWWRAEIAPRLAAQLPDVRLTVAGNDPNGAMRALVGNSEHIQALGWVPETLPYLHAARLSVAPLRVGAGIKIKVGEALMAGLPVVCTSIAAEGLGLADGQHALIADDPDALVEQIVRAYTDPTLWDRLRANGLEHARAQLGRSKLRKAAPAIVAPREAPLCMAAPPTCIEAETTEHPESAMHISLVMNTHNEARNLADAIDSCAGVDEIVVADMASGDDTVNIARRLGATVIALPFAGYCEPGRQTAIDAASGEWVLLLDGDERLSAGGVDLLRRLASETPPYVSAYRLPRPLFVGGARVYGTGWGIDVERHARFFRRHDASWPTHIHATPVFSGEVRDLPAGVDVQLDHYAFPDLESAYAKFNRYSGIEADERIASIATKAQQPSQILADAIAEFERRYEPDRDGALSLALSIGMFMYRFMAGMKVMERCGWPESLAVPSRDSMLAAWSSFWRTLQEAELAARIPARTWPTAAPDCPICGGRDFAYLFQAQRQGDHVWRCSCGLVTYWPRPEGDALLDYYDADYVWAGDGHGYAGGYVAAERETAKRFDRCAFNAILPQVLDSNPDAEILDVGAATGLFVEMARERGVKARGVEPSEPAVAVARERGRPVRLGTLEDEPANSADVITMWDVIEHIDQPVTLLRQAAATLRPGGQIIIRTQDVSCPAALAAGASWEQYVSAHVLHFSPATLQRALALAGFENVRVVEREHYMFTTVATVAFVPAIVEEQEQSGIPIVRLNLACGDDRRPGWINIDAFTPADLQMDVLNLQLDDGVADEALLSHALEHFSNSDASRVLSECRRVLKPGGRLCINVPDLEWVLRNWLSLPEEDRWGWPLATIFGLQDNPGEYHRTGFSQQRLEQMLRQAGFGHVRVVPLFSHGQGCLWAEAWPLSAPQRPSLSALLSPDDGALTERTVRHLVDILPDDAELIITQRPGDAGPFLAQLEGNITWLSNADGITEAEGLAQAALLAHTDVVLPCWQGTSPHLGDAISRAEVAERPEPIGLIPPSMRCA